jgi:PAS domain S-box-containing protein
MLEIDFETHPQTRMPGSAEGVRKMPQELSNQRDASFQLQQISTLLIQEGDLDMLYEHVLNAAIGLMCADVGSMQKYYPEQDKLRLLTSRGFPLESVAGWEWVNRDTRTSCGMALSAGRRIIVPDVECSDVMAGSADLNVSRQAGIRAMHSTPLVSRSGRLLGMISTHWKRVHDPAEQDLRLLDVLARQAADLIERVQVETALRESDHRLRWLASIVESSHDAIVSKDLDGSITTWNRAAQRLFGYTSAEVIGQPITILIPPERHGEESSILERISGGELIENYETVLRRKDGSLVDVSLTISAITNDAGKIVGVSEIARDITTRKRTEAREKMLMAELDHRVKNVLARVAVVGRYTFEGGRPTNELIEALDRRIQSMADAHTLLSQSHWRGVSLADLVRRQLAPYTTETNMMISGPDITLAAAPTQALAMVLQELVTNAVKYGSLSTPHGKLSMNWDRRDGADGKARAVIAWREISGPPTKAPSQTSYGTNLIRNLIPHELGGTVDLKFAPDGLRCDIEIPLDTKLAS